MTPSIPLPSLLDVAKLAAQTASNHAQTRRERRTEAKLMERSDIKLLLDVECQKIATQIILDHFPTHSILGEEDDPSTTPSLHATPSPDEGEVEGEGENNYEWVIDPIDGTINFFHGNPIWCCSVAVRRNGEVLAGCVCAPELNMIFEATLESPALRNGRPIHVSETSDLSRSVIHSGADYAGADKENFNATNPWRFFNAIANAVQRPKAYGSAALDICFVACGAAEGFFEPGIYIWDIAAADLILRRAGGASSIVRQWSPKRFAYVGSNRKIQAALEKIVEPLF